LADPHFPSEEIRETWTKGSLLADLTAARKIAESRTGKKECARVILQLKEWRAGDPATTPGPLTASVQGALAVLDRVRAMGQGIAVQLLCVFPSSNDM
jgi:hypothetical protein